MNAKLTDELRSVRARTLRFNLPDGRALNLESPNVGQMMRALELDPAAGTKETPREHFCRVCEQTRLLVGPKHADAVLSLPLEQVTLILGALYVTATGMSPEGYAAWQQAQRENQHALDRLEILDSLGRATIDIAASLKKLPAEVDEMKIADLVALRELIAQEQAQAARFQAGLHGRKLEGE